MGGKNNRLLMSVSITNELPPGEPDDICCDLAAERSRIVTVLSGYFQNPRLFQKFRPELVERLRVPPAVTMSPLLAVAIGVRQGPDFKELGWALPIAYYIRALKHLDTLVLGRSATIYIFADSWEFVEAEVMPLLERRPKMSAVMVKGVSDVEQMRMMWQCSAHVISNSTFHWWGAWLSIAKGRNIVAPRHWPGLSQRHIIPKDQGWTTFDNLDWRVSSKSDRSVSNLVLNFLNK